ncbi:chalcone-flavanone isomerase-domain-containing protein [Pisolithus orientalis]|uniref:chalcone-flavanone isomerase-domain-containing protein n=1 Tax=Pisolithus orientalis TaxID=936130 RepID=UPI002224A415|nr:chalcone-flavanone isomerase-domain-containing protein [Pisolithus orientalis]KAI6003210.1 chalcone-flavanone isomerase-domain-containing protein [Pisolithus orientalis]
MSHFVKSLASLRVWSTRISAHATTRQLATASASHIPRSRVLKLNPVVLWGAASVLGVAYALHQTNKVHLEAPQAVQQQLDEEIEIDPGTSIAFPKTLQIPSKFPLPKFSLVGVGTRTVSFIGIKVYSVGFYADLNDPKLNVPLAATPEEKIEHIIRNTACVIRIVPTRNTSYTHLRDGFVRALTGRIQLEKSRGALTPEIEFAIQSPLRKLKTLFPNAALTKGTPLDILITAPSGDQKQPRRLVFRDLGSIESDWVSEQFLLTYFEGNGISPPLKKATAERLKSFEK